MDQITTLSTLILLYLCFSPWLISIGIVLQSGKCRLISVLLLTLIMIVPLMLFGLFTAGARFSHIDSISWPSVCFCIAILSLCIMPQVVIVCQRKEVSACRRWTASILNVLSIGAMAVNYAGIVGFDAEATRNMTIAWMDQRLANVCFLDIWLYNGHLPKQIDGDKVPQNMIAYFFASIAIIIICASTWRCFRCFGRHVFPFCAIFWGSLLVALALIVNLKKCIRTDSFGDFMAHIGLLVIGWLVILMFGSAIYLLWCIWPCKCVHTSTVHQRFRERYTERRFWKITKIHGAKYRRPPILDFIERWRRRQNDNGGYRGGVLREQQMKEENAF